MFARALKALGGAQRIAALGKLTPKMRCEIVALIAPLEHVVRKLLFVEAARLPRPDVRPFPVVRRPAAFRAATASARQFDPARPETWPAQFALSPPRDPRLVPGHRAPRIRSFSNVNVIILKPSRAKPPPIAPRAPVSPAFNLARRFEALRRVLKNPKPTARRLARLLVRLRRSFPEVFQHYAAAPSRTGHYDAEDPRLGVECIARAFDALQAFENSS
jgi:hypothetical protein